MTAQFVGTMLRAAVSRCGAGLALFAASALAPAGALAQTSAPLCNPTPTVSDTADANGVYTTTIVCSPREGKGADEADYRHIHWNQPGGRRWAVVRGTGAWHNEDARGTDTPTNNAAGNHVHLTVKSGVVFDADGQVDMRSFPIDGAVRLVAADATVVIEEGAVLNIDRTPAAWHSSHLSRPSTPTDETVNWYPGFSDAVNHQGGINIMGDDGDLTVRHNGVINFNVRNRGSWQSYGSNSSAIYVQNADTTAATMPRLDHDILVELGSTGIIRHVEGSDGGNGIYAEQTLEDGDVRIDLAAGSLIDVTAEGGYGIYARAGFFGSDTNTAPDADNNKYIKGDVIVNAGGTIRAAVKQARTVNIRQGAGITAVHASAGRVRVASSGTLETRQRAGIDARAFSGSQNSKADNIATMAIEGHLVDVTGGTVETRGNTAIYASTGGTNSAFTVRVGEGATVRAQALTEADYENGAISQEDLGELGNAYFTSANIHYYGYRSVELTRTEGGSPTTVNRLEPILTAIVVRNFSSSDPASGVRDHVIVDGTVETVGASEYDPAIWMERGGALTVGATGVIEAGSGLAIASGCDARIAAAVNTTPLWQALPHDSLTPYRLCYYTRSADLTVNVAGRVEGDIRALRGALTANVMDGGVVRGTLRDPQNPYTVVAGASIGRLLYTGGDPITVTVNGGGTLAGDDGKAVESTSATAPLTVIVLNEGRIEGDILAEGPLTATVLDGGVVTATIRDPQTRFTFGDRARIGRLLYTKDSAATVTVADGGTLTGVEGKAVESESTDAAATLAVTVQDGGRVEGDIMAGAALTATVEEGGVVTATIHNPQTPFTVGKGARIGRLLYTKDSAATVTVADGGTLTGVEGKAVESESTDAAATLAVTVQDGGRVEGDVMAGAALTATVEKGGVVTGTIHNPQTPFTVLGEASIGRLLYNAAGTVTVSGGARLTGVGGAGVESTAGPLTVTVQAKGRVEGGIVSGGALMANVMASGLVTGTVRGGACGGGESRLTVAGSVGRVLCENGGAATVAGGGAVTGVDAGGTIEAIRGDAGNLDVAVAANGAVTGRIEGRGAGNLDVAVSGTVTGDIVERGAGNLDVTVSGTLTGGIVGEGAGEDKYKVAVESAGVVTGTVRLPANAEMTIAGKAGRVLYDNGGAITVNANGEIEGIVIEGTREAIRSDAGDLAVTVHGTVTGNIEGRGDGDLTVRVSESGTVAGEIFGRGGGVNTIEIAKSATVLGTVHNPKSGTAIHGAVGRVLLDDGGALTVAVDGRVAGIGGEAIRAAKGDLTVTVAGKATGTVEARGGALDATVTGTVEGDILGLGAGGHTVAIRGGGMVTGTVRLAASEVNVEHGAAGRVLLDKGGEVKVGARGRISGLDNEGAKEAIRADAGDLTVSIASGGAVAGRIEGRGAGKHDVAVASGGSVSGDIVDTGAGDLVASIAGAVKGNIEERGDGDLTATVAGTVTGDISGMGAGSHTVAVQEGGAVTGTVRLPSSAMMIAGRVGRVLYDNGGSISVAATGSISGVQRPGGVVEAIRSSAGNLAVAVAARATVTGDIRGEGDGDLDVDVSGTVKGGIFGLGSGEHEVHVQAGGAVEGLIHLEASTVRVDGSAKKVLFDRGGRVEVGSDGRISGLGGSAVESLNGVLNMTVNGDVMGSVAAGAGRMDRLAVESGGSFDGTVKGVEFVRIAGLMEGMLDLPPGNDVDIPEGGELRGPADGPGGRGAAIVVETGPLNLNVDGKVKGAVDATDPAAASAVTIGGRGEIEGKITLEGAGSEVEVHGVAQAVDVPRGAVTVGENGRIDKPVVSAVAVTVKAAPGESDEEAAQRIGGGRIESSSAKIVLKREGRPDAELRITSDGAIQAGPAPRHRVYEALPSVLLALNALPGHGDRIASARAPRGAWASLDAGSGERRPASSTADARHEYRRLGFEAGMEGAVGENAVFAVSVHHVRGRADVETDGGRIEVAGTGARISGAWVPAGSYYASAQLAATLYEADLDSARENEGALAGDVSGRGWAADVEVGRRLEMGRVALTPRAGAGWSQVDMSSFTDKLNERVSLDDGRRVTVRAGLRADADTVPGGAGSLFATVDVERELSGAQRMTAADRSLKTEAEATWLRLGLGGEHEWAGGRFVLRGGANYAAARSGNRDLGGNASLTVRF